ncbi:RNA methyltransferase [bacterium]|nr:RNA methyltransferase [bacterium]
MEITSVNNDLVKETVKLQQKKYRDKTGKFLLEGRKCVEEAISAGLEIEYLFIDAKSDISGKWKVESGKLNNFQFSTFNFQLNKIIFTTESVLKKISTTDSAPEMVAVAYKKQIKMPKNAKKVVLLENIKDLGNLGTILRTSVAFGVDAVILYGKDCADIYNPKCVRSAVGNLWKIPVVYIENFEELKNTFNDFERVATLPRAKNYLKDFEAKEPVLLMFGSEAEGLSDELIDFSTRSVKIEMSENVESLNLSVSCAVVLYKFL